MENLFKNFRLKTSEILLYVFVGVVSLSSLSCDDTLDTSVGDVKGVILNIGDTKDEAGNDIENLNSIEIGDTREFSIAETLDNILKRADGSLAITWYYQAEFFEIVDEEGNSIGKPASFLGSEEDFYTSISGVEKVTVKALKVTPIEQDREAKSFVEVITDDNGKLDLETRINLVRISPLVTPETLIGAPNFNILSSQAKVGPGQVITLNPSFGSNLGSSLTNIKNDRFLYAIPSNAKIVTDIEADENIMAIEYADSLFVPNLDDPIVKKIKENASNLQLFTIKNPTPKEDGTKSVLSFTIDEVAVYPIYFAYSRSDPQTNFRTPTETPELYDTILEITPFTTLSRQAFVGDGTEISFVASDGESFILPSGAEEDFKLVLGDGSEYDVVIEQVDDKTIKFTIPTMPRYLPYKQRPAISKLIYTQTKGVIGSISGKTLGEGEFVIFPSEAVYDNASEKGTFFVMDFETADAVVSMPGDPVTTANFSTDSGGQGPSTKVFKIEITGTGTFTAALDNLMNWDAVNSEGKPAEYTIDYRILTNGNNFSTNEFDNRISVNGGSDGNLRLSYTTANWGKPLRFLDTSGEWGTIVVSTGNAVAAGNHFEPDADDPTKINTSSYQIRFLGLNTNATPANPVIMEIDNFIMRTLE